MEQLPDKEQLTSALSQVEELERTLNREREERTNKEAVMEETIKTLQESSLANEKKGVYTLCSG